MKKYVNYILISFCIFCLFSLFISKQITGIPSFFGYKPFFIMSESMEPCIHKHQFVLAIPAYNKTDISVGDIIAYDLYLNGNKHIKKTIIHRIQSIEENGTIICKGDNNNKPDKPIDMERLQYKIIKY